jgi:hypothetical protein
VAVPHVVLVDRSPGPASMARLAQVARALQTQVERDFHAVWGVRARVGAARGSAAPVGAWPIVIVGAPPARPGVHLDPDGRPHAEVAAGEGWTLAASHELLEMIADPGGRRFMPGRSLAHRAQRNPVRYLVEVCDPCQVFGYLVDGVEVSDFVTPDYYRADAPAGTAVDFLRRLRRPLEVRSGCCVSWLDSEDGHWHRRCPGGVVAMARAPARPHRSPREDRDRALDVR